MNFRYRHSIALLGIALLGSLEIHAAFEFDLSPPGASAGLGLSPLNEFLAGCPTCGGSGSGDEIGNGITFNQTSLTLSFEIGYGSASGFANLTGQAFAWYLHGPATPTEAGEIIADLSPFHEFDAAGANGGTLLGSISLSPEDAHNLIAGLTYVNIYTTAFPGGEIRGQLLPVRSPTAVPESTPRLWLYFAMPLLCAEWIRRRIGKNLSQI